MKVYILTEIWEMDNVRTERTVDVFASRKAAAAFSKQMEERHNEAGEAAMCTYEILEKEIIN
jgi:hypothetical protein